MNKNINVIVFGMRLSKILYAKAFHNTQYKIINIFFSLARLRAFWKIPESFVLQHFILKHYIPCVINDVRKYI